MHEHLKSEYARTFKKVNMHEHLKSEYARTFKK